MTTISILLEEENRYRALSGDKESTGRTVGEALDAITSQLSDNEGDTLVIVQEFKPDEFFNAAQQARLTELMRLREARALSEDEERELEGLVESELDGARRRAEREIVALQGSEAMARRRRRLQRNVSLLLSDEFSRLTHRERRMLLLWAEGRSLEEIALDCNASVAAVSIGLKKIQRRMWKSIAQKLTEGESESADMPAADDIRA